MECVPAGREESVKVATPLGASAAVPSCEAPSVKTTAPKAAAAPLFLSVAVRVIGLNVRVGFAEEINANEVGCLTVTLTGEDVEPLVAASPEYEATIVCVPGARSRVERIAIPCVPTGALPIA